MYNFMGKKMSMCTKKNKHKVSKGQIDWTDVWLLFKIEAAVQNLKNFQIEDEKSWIIPVIKAVMQRENPQVYLQKNKTKKLHHED